MYLILAMMLIHIVYVIRHMVQRPGHRPNKHRTNLRPHRPKWKEVCSTSHTKIEGPTSGLGRGIFNDALEHHEPLGLGKGVLILIQKPGKPKGPLTSVRPIVLLTTLRKTLSLVVLSRIAPKVDEYLSPSQSGFRRGRSTADVLFGYRWLCAKAQRQRVSIELLGIDLSRAFDTIRHIATFPSPTFGPLFAFHCPLFFTKNNNLECRDVLKTVTVTSDQKRFGPYTAHN